MKFLAVFASCAAVASAQWAAPGWAGAGYAGYAPAGYAGHAWAAPSPWAYAPAYGAGAWGLAALPNGAVVPLDEPSVAAARADHLSHYAGPPVAAFLADEPAVAEAKAAAIAALDAPLVPVAESYLADTEEVAAARAEHLKNFE